ncbi:hypothetical protein [Actinoplanes regularis]|uniref:Uncharacterized protein n=1 Tax=Actinoplanes regularis TaxID=52697 RepID=A0A239GZT8_9ACTN|nr:hypothetical protein [Actinoplanes regularis]GIE90926.1 hypothetical protein Are01nite_74060 [Actinoplanes regularis]SNS73534.1 hypothetical protein SAMN06264365_122103 [Actinoplanes regularis]
MSWLIVAGRTPKQAEQVPTWRTATVRGVTAFAEANAKVWAEIDTGSADPWTLGIMTASETWRKYRQE